MATRAGGMVSKTCQIGGQDPGCLRREFRGIAQFDAAENGQTLRFKSLATVIDGRHLLPDIGETITLFVPFSVIGDGDQVNLWLTTF